MIRSKEELDEKEAEINTIKEKVNEHRAEISTVNDKFNKQDDEMIRNKEKLQGAQISVIKEKINKQGIPYIYYMQCQRGFVSVLWRLIFSISEDHVLYQQGTSSVLARYIAIVLDVQI